MVHGLCSSALSFNVLHTLKGWSNSLLKVCSENRNLDLKASVTIIGPSESCRLRKWSEDPVEDITKLPAGDQTDVCDCGVGGRGAGLAVCYRAAVHTVSSLWNIHGTIWSLCKRNKRHSNKMNNLVKHHELATGLTRQHDFKIPKCFIQLK